YWAAVCLTRSETDKLVARCFGYERPAASPGSAGGCLLLFLNRSSQSHRTPPIGRPTAYISDSAFTRRASREGYLMCHSKARSGPGCCCTRRAERVRFFAESPPPDCRAVPFPLDRDCHHRAQCAACCNRYNDASDSCRASFQGAFFEVC